MKIVLTGGGSGGHVFPLIALVREIKSLYLQKRLEESRNVFGEKKNVEQLSKETKEKLELYYLGPRDEFGLILLAQEGVAVREISAGKIRRYFTWPAFLENILDIFFRIPLGMAQSFFRLFFLAPDIVFSKGGYGSFGVVFSAWLLRIPIFLHESDIDPGLVNKILARFARKVFVSFPKTEKFPLSKMVLTGNPIRKELLTGTREEATMLFRLTGEKPIILILGGSQGAQRINDLVLAVLPNLLAEFELIHQSGEKNFSSVKAEAEITAPPDLKKFYHLFPFLKEEEYKQALAASDLVVSRASGGAVSEISALSKPSVLIPLPEAAQNHQVKNAYAYAQFNACSVLEETNLTPNFFLEKLKYLFSHPLELEKMKKGAAGFARSNAAKNIATYLFFLFKS